MFSFGAILILPLALPHIAASPSMSQQYGGGSPVNNWMSMSSFYPQSGYYNYPTDNWWSQSQDNLFNENQGMSGFGQDFNGGYPADGVESQAEMGYLDSQSSALWYGPPFEGSPADSQSGTYTPATFPSASFTYPDQHNVTIAGTTYVPYENLIPNKVPSGGIPNKAPAVEPVYPDYPDLMNLLNPDPVRLPEESCITADGEAGQCMTAEDCGYTNGVVNGLCHEGMDNADHLRICCIYPSYCGYETNQEVTYFKNPDYPNPTLDTDLCHYRVNLLPEVCQLRVDFLEFSMKEKSSSGACEKGNRMSISSSSKRAFIPAGKFCGQVEDVQDPVRTDLHHFYVHVDEVPLDAHYAVIPRTPEPYIDFKVKVSNHNSKWNLRISQITCEDAPLQAPSGCSQYYTEENATLSSLDIVDRSEEDIQMAACIKTDPTACAIRYELKSLQLGDAKRKRTGRTQLGYGLTCKDYIAFNGMKSGICGFAVNKDITLPIYGPQGFTYASEKGPKVGESGYQLMYTYLHKCDESTNYFSYPSAK